MASRIERYYKNELSSQGRSERNKNLYKQIEDMDTYYNIESVVSIENTNEIEISKVKEMIKDRETYKKQKELNNVLFKEPEPIEEEIKVGPKEEVEKDYNINNILNKAKENEPIKEENYALTNTQYNLLKSLNKKGKDYDLEKEEAELKELINTITSKKALNKIDEDETDDVGLLDELKSDTMIGDASSIKKIIDEEKKIDDTVPMDKTFLTSSMGFTQKDFEEFKDMKSSIIKSNKFIIILSSIIGVLVIAIVIFLLLKWAINQLLIFIFIHIITIKKVETMLIVTGIIFLIRLSKNTLYLDI